MQQRANKAIRRRDLAAGATTECGGDRKAQFTPETILVVEDNPAVQALARAFLEMAGYSVVTASDGEEGFRIYQQLQSRIGLLLTDVSMPKMNGLDLAGRVLELDSQLPVVLMSGDVVWSDGSFECITKPFTPGELACLVGRVLEASEKRPLAMATAGID